MEASDLIKLAAEQCVESFTLCLGVPALKENEWVENRLADINLWISGTGACAQSRASLDSRLDSMPEARDLIANLLHLLGTAIDEYRMQSQNQEAPNNHHDEEYAAFSDHEDQGRAFSPWSDSSSSDDPSEDDYDAKAPSGHPLRELMYNIESMQDQLARIAVAIRRSGRRSRLQRADQRFEPTEHQELEGHLTGILLTQLKCHPHERDSSKLSEVQLRLIRCNLKRRNRFLYAQQHSRGLNAGSIRRRKYTAVPKESGLGQEDMIGAKRNSKPPSDGMKHATSTTNTGTSASEMTKSFNLPQSDHTAPAASTIMTITATDLDYPYPPRFKDGVHLFRCPCCCEALPVTMADKNRWRKHIADDLSAYTCILPGCDQPDILFNTKEAWKQHMLKDHSSMRYWSCFVCEDSPQFNNQKAFVQHTKSNHAATIAPDQIPILVDVSKKTAPTDIRHCPLCNLSAEEGVELDKEMLFNHIAKDIHSFSLRSLPWADNNAQENDERIHGSSEKVYEWLIKYDIQQHPSIELPPHETRVCHSEYFQQNAYFAGSSNASSSSEPDSCRSRENDLKELRKMGDLLGHESREARTNKLDEEAELLELPVIEAREMKVDEDHHGKLASMINPPSTYIESGQSEEAVGSSVAPRRATHGDLDKYTVMWICAVVPEYVAAQALLDEDHETPVSLPSPNRDEFFLGRMGKHNVVIAVLPYGYDVATATAAALVAEGMLQNFQNIRIILMVGVGGGVPSREHDIRLGDIVVSDPRDGDCGVVQYDFHKAIQKEEFKPTESIHRPPMVLRQAVSGLQAQYELEGHQIKEMISDVLKWNPRLRRNFDKPDPTNDRLYQSHVVHPADGDLSCQSSCSNDFLVSRPPRTEEEDNPAIHYGLIASSNGLMKDAITRDKLAAQTDILCIEMEAAELAKFPCLVIRGICDYSDSHRNSLWRGYAAMTAAAYAKELLSRVDPRKVEQEAKIINGLNERLGVSNESLETRWESWAKQFEAAWRLTEKKKREKEGEKTIYNIQ